jgi:hypothetical protein
MMGGIGVMAGLGWPGMVTMLLFWAGVVVLVIWGVSSLCPGRRPAAESGAVATPHHEAAIGMARQALAEALISGQTVQIEEMRSYLHDLFGAATP